jgi:hypothetical protein
LSATSNRVVVAVAVIGLVGTLGAALIANWDSIFGNADGGVTEGPHAPAIELNQIYTIWGEGTTEFSLQPGETETLRGLDLYADQAGFPLPSCAGPGFVAYTWQIRDPYPEGGELEIRSVLMGGATERVALGAVGAVTMGACEEHTFANNGTVPLLVEVRYATAAELSTSSP